MKTHRGYTLLEVMGALSIFSVVMGTLFTLSIGMSDTAQVQQFKAMGNDEGRRTMLTVVPMLHAASRGSINYAQLPGNKLVFRSAADVDGNGTAVNVNGKLELGTQRVVQRDVDDANGDKRTDTQLVLIEGAGVTILADHLRPTGPALEDGTVPGFWVTAEGAGIRIALELEGETRQGNPVRFSLTELVQPRNP